MALGFFRRNQKMVIIIMVILMVSFLVTIQGVEGLFRRDSKGVEIGRTRYGPLTRQDVDHASFELSLLQQLQLPAHSPLFLQVLTSRNSQLSYALLREESTASGMMVSRQQVDNFLGQIGLTGSQYTSFINQMRQNIGAGADDLNQAVAQWLAMEKLYMLHAAVPPASDQSLRHLYRDLSEQAQVRFVALKAEDFLE